MTAKELYEFLKERNAEDLPLMFDNGECFEYITDIGISVYIDCVQID